MTEAVHAKSEPSDFSTLVISLASNAMLHLGGEERSEPVNLPMARQAIDLLAMLEHKTKGNLTGEEAELLEGVLYQCRIAYAEAAK
jgi:hypothetical protein